MEICDVLWMQTTVTKTINIDFSSVPDVEAFLIMVIKTLESYESNQSGLKSRMCLNLCLIYLMDVKTGTETLRRWDCGSIFNVFSCWTIPMSTVLIICKQLYIWKVITSL